MYYPLMVELKNKNICIVGAGEVSLRKVKKFLEYEATVTVVSRGFKKEFYNLKEKYKHNIKLIKDEFNIKYIEGAFLVEAATNDYIVNEEIVKCCKNRNILCNVVNNKEQCDVIVPSTFKRGDLIISISTLGNSPSFCTRIRKELQEKYGEDVGDFVSLLGEGRSLVLEKINDEEEKKKILNSMAYMSLEDLKEFILKMKG